MLFLVGRVDNRADSLALPEAMILFIFIVPTILIELFVHFDGRCMCGIGENHGFD